MIMIAFEQTFSFITIEEFLKVLLECNLKHKYCTNNWNRIQKTCNTDKIQMISLFHHKRKWNQCGSLSCFHPLIYKSVYFIIFVTFISVLIAWSYLTSFVNSFYIWRLFQHNRVRQSGLNMVGYEITYLLNLLIIKKLKIILKNYKP